MKKALFLLLMLSACCSNNDNDCTAEELAQRKEEYEFNHTPQFIAEKDGVKVYCLYCNTNHRIYFTTPCGDTSWTEYVSHGKTREEVPHQINGTRCDK